MNGNAKESRLLERWRRIEDGQEDFSDDQYRRLKESWFVDAFAFLKALPAEQHCWCSHRDVAMPLVETFHGYFKSPDENLSIKVLWRRLALELQTCMSCIVIYYKVKEFYKNEYVGHVVKPILAVLLALDKRRLTSCMRDLLKSEKPDERSIVCVLYEVFMYSDLLDDADLNDALVQFLTHITKTHDFQFKVNRSYPGLYALLFHCSEAVRNVAFGLLNSQLLEKLKNVDELEPLQPILEKRMKYLESPTAENAIVGMTSESLWQGLMTILKLLKAPAIEEGIVERYPLFIGMVLNYVSERSTVLRNALCCLEILLEVLGVKLWLKCSFSPAVLRNTLVSQCFHAREENIHKSIFQIMQLFLQSLESIQDGQYEKQRRFLLYFLLQQVPFNRNFGSIIKKLASQVAFDIVIQSFKMESPSPPFECAHFWGPPLLNAIKDIELQSQHRQSAIDLAGTILVADAAALSALYCKERERPSNVLSLEDNEEESCSWKKLIHQVEEECDSWHCVPLIWMGVLDITAPFVLCSSFLTAFLWAASRFSILEARPLPTTNTAAYSAALAWESPTGCDDGSDGKGCANSLKASNDLQQLIAAFRRYTDSCASRIQTESINLVWTPSMTEALVLLLMSPLPDLRNLARSILQPLTKDDSEVGFFCQQPQSREFVISGFSHAVKLLREMPHEHFPSLQRIFFLATKFLNSGAQIFCQNLSTVLWPTLLSVLSHGREYHLASGYEVACSRLFELLPLVFKYKIPSTGKNLWRVNSETESPVWFRDLIGWSSTPIVSIRRRCIEALASILEDLARGAVFSRSEDVVNLLRPGSVLDAEQRERLSYLFSSNASDSGFKSTKLDTTNLVKAPEVVRTATQSVAEAESVVPQHKRPVSVRKISVRKIPPKQEAVSDLQKRIDRLEAIHKKHEVTSEVQCKNDRLEPAYKKQEAASDVHRKNGRLDKAADPIISKNQVTRLSERDKEPKVPEQQNQIKGIEREHQVTPTEREAKAESRKVETAKILKELVSDDGIENALESARRQRPSPSLFAPQEKRKLVQLDMPGLAAEMKTSVLARNRRPPEKRSPPKMDSWLMRILCMDVFDANEQLQRLDQVPLSFKSVEHYMAVFQPLLIEEFRAQLHRSRDEVKPDDPEASGMVNLMSLERIDNLHVARFLSEAGKARVSAICMENDLLLISRQPFKECSGGVHLLGKVERREKENKGGGVVLLMKLYFPSDNERVSKAKRLLVNRSKWHITRLMNIAPQLREFQAVSAVSSTPLLTTLLSPGAQPDRYAGRSSQLPGKMWNNFKQDYNETQLAAIKACFENARRDQHQISLVQGPPGTGKTRTIVAIVSALLYTGESSETVETRPAAGKLSYQAAVANSWQAMAVAKYERDHPTKTQKKARVLVCAQSNAAVDELVARLLQNGVYNSDGGFYKPKVVRCGNANAVHADSMPVYIETLIKEAEEKELDNSNVDTDIHLKLEKITDKINEIVRQIAEGGNDDGLKAKLALMEKQQRGLTMEVQKSKKVFEASKLKRKKLKNSIIRDADIVLTTLSGSGGDIYAACMDTSDNNTQIFFDAVVIDEAGQALEPATLIPLQLLWGQHGRYVMVGDPKQLPATVLSQAAENAGYGQSMFERFQLNNFPVTMLLTQYRMHPEIRKFPSLHFYKNLLMDGQNVLGNNRLAIFHKDSLFGPYAFLDVIDGQENAGGSFHSIANLNEVAVAVELYDILKARYPQHAKPGCIGVITPYKQQLLELQKAFTRRFGSGIASTLEFNTIDGFQGREVDILILSTVRAHQTSSIGFVADERRMNVALTRARFSLWIIGNARTLQNNRTWAALLEDATARGVVRVLQRPYSMSGKKSIARNFETREHEAGSSRRQRERADNLGENRDNKRQKVDGDRGSFGSRGIKILDNAPDVGSKKTQAIIQWISSNRRDRARSSIRASNSDQRDRDHRDRQVSQTSGHCSDDRRGGSSTVLDNGRGGNDRRAQEEDGERKPEKPPLPQRSSKLLDADRRSDRIIQEDGKRPDQRQPEKPLLPHRSTKFLEISLGSEQRAQAEDGKRPDYRQAEKTQLPQSSSKVLHSDRRSDRRAQEDNKRPDQIQPPDQRQPDQRLPDQKQADQRQTVKPSSAQVRHSGNGRRVIDANESKRRSREEAAAFLSGALLDSRKPGSSSRQGIPQRRAQDSAKNH